jgi:hypothetical protein
MGDASAQADAWLQAQQRRLQSAAGQAQSGLKSARQGMRAEPRQLAAKLWTAHKYSLKPDIHPSLLDGEDEKDREAGWRQCGYPLAS